MRITSSTHTLSINLSRMSLSLAHAEKEKNRPKQHREGILHALDLVVDLRVQLAQAVEVVLRRVPVAAAVRLKEGRDHVAEGVRVRLEQARFCISSSAMNDKGRERGRCE